jgi:hypothetical protein
VLTEVLAKSALAPSARLHYALLVRLGQAYTQIEAPVGPFGLDTLRASTRALVSRSPGDRAYASIEHQLAGWVPGVIASAPRCATCYSVRNSAAGQSTQGRQRRSSVRRMFC